MRSDRKQVFAWAVLAAAGCVAGLTPRIHAQEQLWIRQFGTRIGDSARTLAPDGAGGVIVAGGTFSSPNGQDVVLARYDSAGDRLWIRQFGSRAWDQAYGLASDGEGGVMIAGYTLGHLSGRNAGGTDAFLARYDSAGNQLWIRQFGTRDSEVVHALAPDGTGGVMVAGYMRGRLETGNRDAFLARYDSAGVQLWFRQFGSSSSDEIRALAPDGAGGVLAAGYTSGDLGGPNAGGIDAFLARYDSAGDRLWIRQFGTSGLDIAYAVASDGTGGAIVAGDAWDSVGEQDAFLARYDSAGERLWIRVFGTSSGDHARALAPDGAGGVLVAGSTSGSLGGLNAGSSDAFLARYDSAGDRVWIRQFGSSSVDVAGALAPGGAGSVMVAGNAGGSLGGRYEGPLRAFVARFTHALPLGDLNCDGAFDGADIDPFFLALGDPAAYLAAFPDCSIDNADMNCDQAVNGADIDRFFACLAGNNCPDCNANGTPDDCEAIGPLTILMQPQSTLACVGDIVVLSVKTSSFPLTVQWRKNGVPIAGATFTRMRFNPVQLSDAGDYDVILGDACVSLASDSAALTVHTAPSIASHPRNQRVCFGAPLVLSVDASGPALTYQWRKDGTDIPGATDPTYIIPAVSESDRGAYDVKVANTCDTVWSVSALITIQTTILTHPAGQTVCENDPVFFTAGATGAALTYQWRKDGVNINGATQNFFVINAAAMSDAGIYDVVVTSPTCTQTSEPATLIVQTCP